jgi:hypothetical protein
MEEPRRLVAEDRIQVRLILSRKGFDSESGGSPSPIFPDASLLSLPIPDKLSPVAYGDLTWHGRNLGDLVSTLTKGRQRADYRAHVDPDINPQLLPKPQGWRALFGQDSAAQGHLRNQGVGVGDLFLFWGLFRHVNQNLQWTGRHVHHIWGWMQIGGVHNVDTEIRPNPAVWGCAKTHPHLAMKMNPTNTLYSAPDRLAFLDAPGSGTFQKTLPDLILSAADARLPSEWALPICFDPGERVPMTYHTDASRWSPHGDHVRLRTAARGQEFVLDLDAYPDILAWLKNQILAHC